MRNPYIVGPQVEGQNFYNRQTLIQDLLNPNRAHIYLFGNRRIGKTSLLYALKNQAQEVCLLVSLQGMTVYLDQLVSALVDTMVAQLQSHPGLEAAGATLAAYPARDMAEVLEGLGQVAEQNHFHILLLLDEAEELLRLNADALNRLRRAIENQTHVRTILAATRMLAKHYMGEADGGTSPFLNGFEVFYISTFLDDEAQDLIRQTRNSEGQVEVDDPALFEQICDLTGNHPYLIELLCSHLFRRDGTLRPIQKEDLMAETQVSLFCWSDFQVLSLTERLILFCLAENGPLTDRALSRRISKPLAVLDAALSTLVLLGTLRVREGRYQVGNVFMKNWLMSSEFLPEFLAGESLLVSDQASQEITNQVRLQKYNSSIVRILGKGGDPVGCGFLVDRRHVLTCAHVVQAALGHPKNGQDRPSGKIDLDFPIIDPAVKVTARVVAWQAPLPGVGGDIALLEVYTKVPKGASPAPLVDKRCDLWRHSFRAYGLPDGYRQGVWASGQLLARIDGGWVCIEDVKQTGHFVQVGFSGGPVWDERLNGIVGMVVTIDESPELRVAYMIPCELFLPLLQASLQSPHS
jgi:hypothetical protein